MYSNYNMVQNYPNMYPNNVSFDRNTGENIDERFFIGNALAPFLLGGIAGYAFGELPFNNNSNNQYFYPNMYPYPYPYPYPYYQNNIYYPPYYR